MDTAILAAIIGAIATIASTWLGRWSPRPASAEAGVAAVPVAASGPPMPSRTSHWLGYLMWDLIRLVVRNLAVFGMFVALIYCLKVLGVGQLEADKKAAQISQSSRVSQPLDPMLIAGLVGSAAAIGLGIAEALTRWSPWRK